MVKNWPSAFCFLVKCVFEKNIPDVFFSLLSFFISNKGLHSIILELFIRKKFHLFQSSSEG